MTSPIRNDEEIFLAAISVPEAERVSYLESACRKDVDQLNRLKRLLFAHEDTGFMISPAPGFSSSEEVEMRATCSNAEKAGDHVGPYRLVEQIGEGGFGMVWKAEQEKPLRRRVALKIIKVGMDTKEVVARFHHERQALAVMEHPNIAKIFDAGVTEFGRPYFVMELVDGVNITDFCDQEKLSTRARVNLFVQVCQAVQHAHQKGIIHRDLKPSNILVYMQNGEAMPKVIDFGVAKATQRGLIDSVLVTVADQTIGTPLYMAPEQAQTNGIRADTRSDVYSLGILLYELLTGRTPFAQQALVLQGWGEMLRVIREEQPHKPSTSLSKMRNEDLSSVSYRRSSRPAELIKAVAGDLDAIAMKALEKDPCRRYPTVDNLISDLRKSLANQPIDARCPSTTYVVGRWMRRHKVRLLELALGAAIIGASFVYAAWHFKRYKDDLPRGYEGPTGAYARRGQYGSVERMLENRLRSIRHFGGRHHSEKANVLSRLAVVRFAAGNLGGYKAACVEMVQSLRDWKHFPQNTYFQHMRVLLLDSGAALSTEREAMAGFSDVSLPSERSDPESRAHTLALWAYRQGEYESAVRQLEAPRGDISQPMGRIVLAMALWRLERRVDAAAELRAADLRVNWPAGRADDWDKDDEHWDVQFVPYLLLQEAKALIHAQGK